MFMRIKVNLFIEMTVFVCLFFFIYSTLIFQCILGIHYIQTFICLWPFVYCWWPCETPEVEQLKLEMDPWLVVSPGWNCWGWSTRLRQTKTDPNAGVIFVFCWCSTLFGMMILLKSEQGSFVLSNRWLMGWTWWKHSWNKRTLNCVLSSSVVGSMFVKIYCWLFECPLVGLC